MPERNIVGLELEIWATSYHTVQSFCRRSRLREPPGYPPYWQDQFSVVDSKLRVKSVAFQYQGSQGCTPDKYQQLNNIEALRGMTRIQPTPLESTDRPNPVASAMNVTVFHKFSIAGYSIHHAPRRAESPDIFCCVTTRYESDGKFEAYPCCFDSNIDYPNVISQTEWTKPT
ncbi:hypothetical protein CPC08DRAFT_803746 [Agrocybe pediades]|nr:hypothetical protein CPC08DRAFT_803746 [Agrocybe pediades]